MHHSGTAGSVHALGWKCSSVQRGEVGVTGVGPDPRRDWAGALSQSWSGASTQQAGWW